MATNYHFESSELIAPVTALKFVDNKLFVGESAYLKIYDAITTEQITVERVLSNQRVHRIEVCESNDFNVVAVCGGREACFLYFNQRTSELTLEKTSLYNDWIWDISILPISETTHQIILATAHNTVWLWNVDKNEKCKIAICEEQCILYCARFFGATFDSMWLACGTVFNEILLWRIRDTPDECGVTKIRTRLPGHHGVIFSITYDKLRNLLCSVSDDRSVKIWKLVTKDEIEICAQCIPMLTLYGHKARVWDSLILNKYIVTIGEDSMCLLWNFNGEIMKSFSGHTGKSIWSLAVGFNEGTLATGGGDGGVRLWTLSEERECRTHHVKTDIPQKECNVTDSPRCLGFLANNDVLVLTEKGNFYKYLEDDKWQLFRHEPNFCSYSVMALSPCRNLVAIGNIDGEIKLFSAVDETATSLHVKPFTNKILSLQWLEDEENDLNLFICGPEGCVLWWKVSYNLTEINYEEKNCLCLPYCRQRWPNTIFIAPRQLMAEDNNEMLVICGDRRGSLHVFDGSKTNKNNQIEPTYFHIGVHGNNGVTHITCHQNFIYTTGRDGYYRQYRLNDGNLMLIDKRKTYKGFDWIEQLFFTSDGDLLIIGFHAVDFIIWSRKSNTVLHRIPCGGGHRVWDISYKNFSSENIIMFTYLKKTTINIHTLPLKIKTNNNIIQESFHGREATCVLFIPVTKTKEKDCTVRVLVTGSEDTNINIMAFIPSETYKRLFKLSKCPGHISSVRCLQALTTDKAHNSTNLLFSGGGRASLKCWSLNLAPIYARKPGISRNGCEENPHAVCTLLAELPNRLSKFKKKRKDKGGCDVRFMSLSVFSLAGLGTGDLTQCGVVAGCSDGLLRLYVLDTGAKSFRLLCETSWHDKCILTVGHFIFDTKQPRLVVHSADTAGRVAFWDLTDVFITNNLDFNDSVIILRDESEEKDKTGILNTSETEVTISETPNELSLTHENVYELSSIKGQEICGNFAHGSGLTPFCDQIIHQSGVNCCSLQQLRDCSQYILCSGGDDGAVTIALFELQRQENNVFMKSWLTEKVPDAHTSSTTGVKIIDDNLILSTSVDQTLKLWKFDIDKKFTKITVDLIGSHFVDVADIQDIDVQRNTKDKLIYFYRDDNFDIALCGVGIQLITLQKSQKNE